MAYTIFKHIHMLTAYLTVTLFALRLLMDAVGRPGWRQTPLRWIPHANDTLLLVAAIGLVAVTPWRLRGGGRAVGRARRVAVVVAAAHALVPRV